MNRWLILGMAVLIALGWGVSGFLVFRALPSWEARAAFGEMFGAVNALFAGLAFAGVVIALLFQRAELQLQREELRLAREEQARLTSTQQEASRSLDQQFLIQTLAARIAILQTTVIEASSALDRATNIVAAAAQIGQSGIKTEDLAPGALDRLQAARQDIQSLFGEIRQLAAGNRP